MSELLWFRSHALSHDALKKWQNANVAIHCVSLFNFDLKSVDLTGSWDVCIVTSQHVESTVSICNPSIAKRWMAVGPATAALLLRYGIVADIPDRFSLDGLVNQYRILLEKKSVLVLTGHPFQSNKVSKISMIAEKVRHVVCYQRMENEDVSWISNVVPGFCLVLTSQASLKYFFYLYEKHFNITKDMLRFIACSDSVYASLKAWGANSVVQAQSPYEKDVWAAWEREYGLKTRSQES